MPDAIPPGPPPYDEIPDSGHKQLVVDPRIAASAQTAVRDLMWRAIVAVGLPVVVAVVGGIAATYVTVQVQDERMSAQEQGIADLAERVERQEAAVDRMLDIRGEIAALKATVDGSSRATNTRLERIERALDSQPGRRDR